MQFLDETLNCSSPAEGLAHFLTNALEKNRQRAFIGGCIFGNTALEASDSSPAYAEFVAGVFDAWIGKVAYQVEQAQQQGQLRNDLPSRELAEMVVATVEGGIMQARLLKSEAPLRHTLDTLRKVLGLH